MLKRTSYGKSINSSDGSRNMRQGGRSDFGEILILINGVTIMWILVVVTMFWNSYRGIDWTFALSFNVDDSWCSKDKSEGVGVHCFGDFGLMHELGRSPNNFLRTGPGADVTPFSAIVFKLVSMLGYNLGLVGISLLYCFLMVHMLYNATERLDVTFRIHIIVFVGLLTSGMLVAIDRSNPIAFIPYLLYWYLKSIERKKFTKAAVLLAFMASIKFWAILFIIALVSNKKFRITVLSLLLSGALYLTPLLILPGNLSLEIRNNLTSVFDREYGALISKFSISTYGFVLKVKCFADSCDTTKLGNQISYGTTIAILLVLIYTTIAFVSIRILSDYPEIKYLPLICMGFLAVPEAGSYNAALMSTIVAIFIWFITENYSGDKDEKYIENVNVKILRRAAVISLVITTPPIAAFGSLWFSEFKTMRIQTASIPIIWNMLLLLMVGKVFVIWKKRPCKTNSKQQTSDVVES